MADLMTASGRSAALKQFQPSLRRLESTLAKQSRPLMRTLQKLDGATLAKIGGGVAAFAAIFFAAQSLLTKKAGPEAKAPAKRPRWAPSAQARAAKTTRSRKAATRAS